MIQTSSFPKKMRTRLGCLFLALILSCTLFVPFAYADVRNSDIIKGETVSTQGFSASLCPSINAEYAYLVDANGTVFFERNSSERVQIASLTKIMTALVAVQYGDLDDTTITVSQNAATIGESSASLKAGDSMNLRTALKALMVCSGNDAAVAIAESMGDSILNKLPKNNSDSNFPTNGYDAFVYAMNLKAQELGMNDSLFANPHGLDFDQYDKEMYSTAKDVYLMSKAFMDDSYLSSIVSNESESITVTRDGAQVELVLESTDELLGVYNGACGIKTGFTNKAGACFAGACNKNSKMLYSVVLGSADETQRFEDTKALWNWYYDNYVNYNFVHSDEKTSYQTNDGEQKTVPVVAYESHKGWVDKTFKVTLENPNEYVEVFRLDGNVSQEFHFDDVVADVHIGDKVGTVDFKQNNQVIATATVVAAEECAGPNFIEGIGVWFDRLIRTITGQETEAQSVVVNKTPVLISGNSASTNF
ncbi:MAG: D-alanyl-D-alanine carboxypeptidase family protein [Anaerotardibacter sp.]